MLLNMFKKLLLIGIFIYILIVISFQLTPIIQKLFNIELDEPELGTYTSDEIAFLKTFYLMEGDNNYYSAFKISRENYAIGNLVQSEISTWRLPLSFYLWNIFAQKGEDILTIFIIFMFTFFICSYFLLRQFMPYKFAVLGPLVLFPYFYDSFRYKTSFLFTEWWGLFFFLIGLVAISYKRTLFASLGFILAMLTRELFVIPVICFLIFHVITKKQSKYLLGSLLVFMSFYFFHWFNVTNILAQTDKVDLTVKRIHLYDLFYLHKLLSFSMREYVFLGIKTHYMVLLLGLTSILFKLILDRKSQLAYWFIAIISLLVFLPLISVKENDSWGITFVPLILLSVPLFLSFSKNDIINIQKLWHVARKKNERHAN